MKAIPGTIYFGDEFKLPVVVAQLAGVFPLSFKKSKESGQYGFAFSWRSFGVAMFLFRIVITIASVPFVSQHHKKLQLFFGEWNSAAAMSQTVTNGLVTWTDLAWGCILILQGSKLNNFFIGLNSYCKGVWRHYEDLEEVDQLIGTLTPKLKLLQRITILVLILAIASYIGSLAVYIPRSFEVFSGEDSTSWILTSFALALLLLQYYLASQFRLLSFILLVSFIITFQLAYTILKAKVDNLNKSQKKLTNHTFNPEKDVNWIIKHFDKLDYLLNEFHSIFGFQMVLGILLTLITMLDGTFQLLVIIMNLVKGVNEVSYYQIGDLWPLVISLILVFYLLCDAATGMTTEAKDCVLAFRDCPDFDDYPPDLKEKVLLFYIQRITKPPQISPWKLYNLGRHLFPTVLSIMTTYLIVLYQFQMQE